MMWKFGSLKSNYNLAFRTMRFVLATFYVNRFSALDKDVTFSVTSHPFQVPLHQHSFIFSPFLIIFGFSAIITCVVFASTGCSKLVICCFNKRMT